MTDSDGCSGEDSNDFHAYYYFMDCELQLVIPRGLEETMAPFLNPLSSPFPHFP